MSENTAHGNRTETNKDKRILQEGDAASALSRLEAGHLFVDGDGYVFTYVPNHPGGNGRGFVPLHRFVMEKQIGRFLWSHEIVHHRDGNRQNNAPENLELLASKKEHQSRHNSRIKKHSSVEQMTAEELKEHRVKMGRNQVEMAAEIGASHRAYQDWEYGKYPVPPMVAVVMRLMLEKDTWIMQKIVSDASESYMKRQGAVMERFLRRTNS